MRTTHDAYTGGYLDHHQLDAADALAGDDLTEDRLDAGYTVPERETAHLRAVLRAEGEQSSRLDEQLAAEEPEVSEADLSLVEQEPRVGRLVRAAEATRDVGGAGWGASAEEAAMHLVAL